MRRWGMPLYLCGMPHKLLCIQIIGQIRVKCTPEVKYTPEVKCTPEVESHEDFVYNIQ